MNQKLRSRTALLPPLALLALLLWMPADAAAGARNGLSVCAGVIVPSLFPFLILSGLLRAQGLPDMLARRLGPLLARLGLPSVAAVPFFLGLCGGYPVGADAVASLVRDGVLSPEEGARLLPVCNNTGPGFIIGVAGSAVFGSARVGALLYVCHIIASVSLALLARKRAVSPEKRPVSQPPRGISAFPECVSSAVGATLNICGCVVFFSVLTALVKRSGLFDFLAAIIARRFHLELRLTAALLTGLLELSSGVAALRGMTASPQALALAAFLLGFGGLSVHVQTLQTVSGTKIRCARHFAGRIIHGLLSAAYAVLFSALMRLQI